MKTGTGYDCKIPLYDEIWIEPAREQCDSFSEEIQRVIIYRVKELLEDPTGDDPNARYYRRYDEWSIPFTFGSDEGFIYYAVTEKPKRAVIVRQLVFGG